MGTILIWMTAALILGQIFKTLSLPVIVGFIASGYLFSIVDFADEQGLLEIPSEVGIELLLFSIGLKIRPSYFLNPDLIIVFLLHSLMVVVTQAMGVKAIHQKLNLKSNLAMAKCASFKV